MNELSLCDDTNEQYSKVTLDSSLIGIITTT